MSALEITSGAELERFDMGTLLIGNTPYTVLTGFEGNDRICFWCGEPLKGKAKHFCRGHMTAYYNHFNWGYASFEARKRSGYKCENCGQVEGGIKDGYYSIRTNLEVHHIVPLKGEARFFSAFNLPWNLIVLCHNCHQEIHATMRPAKKQQWQKVFDEAVKRGQLSMNMQAVLREVK